MADSNPFANLSKLSLQDALLRRLSELSNARRTAREHKHHMMDLKDEIRQISELLTDGQVVPFVRTIDLHPIVIDAIRKKAKTGTG